MEGWTIREGGTGAGEPMSVGVLVAIDGFDVVMVWAGESVSDARACRLRLKEWVTTLRSMSSRALFLLCDMLGCSEAQVSIWGCSIVDVR